MTELRFFTGLAQMPDGPVYALTTYRERKWWQFWLPRRFGRETTLLQMRGGRWFVTEAA